MDVALLQWIVVWLIAVVAGCGLVFRFAVWSSYVAMRAERDELRERIVIVRNAKDEWRNVAERSLFLAEAGRRVSSRAAGIARQVVQDIR